MTSQPLQTAVYDSTPNAPNSWRPPLPRDPPSQQPPSHTADRGHGLYCDLIKRTWLCIKGVKKALDSHEDSKYDYFSRYERNRTNSVQSSQWEELKPSFTKRERRDYFSVSSRMTPDFGRQFQNYTERGDIFPPNSEALGWGTRIPYWSAWVWASVLLLTSCCCIL